MAALFMIAIEATIVSTAMPQIAGQLGDLHLYSWVFSSFLLTQTATTVVFGKLSDLYGRKPVLLVGIAVFLLGTALCGLAWSMPSLIVFRLLQGGGAGAIQPVCLTVVGDLYSVQERGKIQGYLASVWGISSVLGPLAGGLIIQHLSWSWIFWINLPVGLLASTGFVLFLHESVAHKEQSVDIAGAALFTVAVASLMAALTEAGTSDHAFASMAAGVCVVSTVLFVLQERRARDPMMDFGLWARRPIATANAATLLSGMTVIGLTTFLPMYVQGVLNQSALVAGFTLDRDGAGLAHWCHGRGPEFRPLRPARDAACSARRLLPVGALAFLFMEPGVSPAVAGMGSTVMGFGMGFLSTSAIVIIQDSVGWGERGSATASNIFSRNLGSTLGATALGAVLNISLAHRGGGAAAVHFDQIRQLLDHSRTGAGDDAIRAALGQSLHLTFWAVFAIAASTLVLATLVPSVAMKPGVRPAAAE